MLSVVKSDDVCEQEADQVADQVMRMPDPLVQRQKEEEEEGLQAKPMNDIAKSLVQRRFKSEEDEEGTIQGQEDSEEDEELQASSLNDTTTSPLQRQIEPDEEEEPIQAQIDSEEEEPLQAQEEEEEEALQAKTDRSRARSSRGVHRSIRAMRGGGQPLPDAARRFFEPRLGRYFGQVRVHSDARATRTARALRARAFTTGRDIFFGRGQYAPHSQAGQRLLAHELTHVIQQEFGDSAVPSRLFRAPAGGSASEVESSQESYAQDYQWHLRIAILRLETAAARARAQGGSFFGRTVSGKCRPVQDTLLRHFPAFAKLRWLPIATHEAFDPRYWSYKVDCDAGEAELIQVRGNPSEAIDEMFDNLHVWTFDCAEYLQVARWYAQRHTLGAAAFDAKMSALGGLTLRPHGSTGILTRDTYIRHAPHTLFYRENNVAMRTEPSDKFSWQILAEAPIGSRITWTNAAAPTSGDTSRKWWSFGNQNAIKLGDNQFAAHPFGTVTREEIEFQLAAKGYVKEMEEAGKWTPSIRRALLHQFFAEWRAGRLRPELQRYILDKIYISNIRLFKLY